MPVPLLDLSLQHGQLEADLKAAFARVLRSNQFILGPEVAAFEEEIGAFIGSRHAVGVSSGTDAILLALMALDIGPGDEVICPAFTFFATAGCIARVGARPVFADIDPRSFNLDVEDAARRVTNRTRAIIPVHLFGQMADMDAVMDLAKQRNLHVIEDAAQAIGATSRGRQAGTIGDFGAFSFFPSKNLGGFGDAGLLTARDREPAERARVMRVHGMQPKYYHPFIGGNFRIDAIQAALLRVKLPRLPDYASRRQSNASFYLERLAAPADGDNAPLALPSVSPGNVHIWNQFTIRVAGGRRDALRARLTERGIGSEIYYPLSLHQQECFVLYGQYGERLENSERAADECLSLPVYPELSEEQLGAVAEAVADFFR